MSIRVLAVPFHSSLVRGVALFALGFFTALLLVAKPDWWVILWSVEAASWAAAIGTAFAGLIALWLGLDASQREERRQSSRSASVAAAFMRPFNSAMAFLSAIEAYKAFYEQTDFLGSEAPRYRDSFLKLEALLPETHSALVAELPADTARWISLADQALRRTQGILIKFTPSNDRATYEIAEKIFEVADSARHAVSVAATNLHQQVYGAGSVPPWEFS